MDLTKLREQFPAGDLEWRIGQAGKRANGEIWAKVLAYLTNRAIMDRLDDVCGPENWCNEYRELPNGTGGCLCGISICCDGQWITKWDGAQNTDIEAIKGGLSDAMKRAAVQWGMGRYLYRLPKGWANVSKNGSKDGSCVIGPKKERVFFRWDPPAVPTWALPGGSGHPAQEPPPQAGIMETPQVQALEAAAEIGGVAFVKQWDSTPKEIRQHIGKHERAWLHRMQSTSDVYDVKAVETASSKGTAALDTAMKLLTPKVRDRFIKDRAEWLDWCEKNAQESEGSTDANDNQEREKDNPARTDGAGDVGEGT